MYDQDDIHLLGQLKTCPLVKLVLVNSHQTKSVLNPNFRLKTLATLYINSPISNFLNLIQVDLTLCL